jgi:ABC-type transport system substrate-binding protein
MRRSIRAGAATAMLLAALTAPTTAQAPGPAVTVATVEWIEQFDPGVLASGPGLNYKGSMFDSVVGAGPGGALS